MAPARHLILHIGKPKTGTTSLQRAFHLGREAMLAHGVFYPPKNHGQQHGAIKAYFQGPKFAPHGMKMRFKYDDERIAKFGKESWHNLVSQVEEVRPDTLVLSSEQMYGAGKARGFVEMMSALRSLADKTSVVCYLREPSGNYLSQRQQGLKQRGILRNPSPNLTRQMALEHFMRLDDVTLHVHDFSRKSLVDGDIVSDFAAKHLSKEAGETLLSFATVANDSMSPEAMNILHELWDKGHIRVGHRKLENSEKARMMVRNVDDEVEGKTRPAYKPNIAAQIYDTAQDLEWLKATFGIEFKRPSADESVSPVDLEKLSTTADFISVDERRQKQIMSVIAERMQQNKMHAKASKHLGVLTTTITIIRQNRFAKTLRKLRRSAVNYLLQR